MIAMEYFGSQTIDIALIAISVAIGMLILNWFYLTNRMRKGDKNGDIKDGDYNKNNFICSLILTFTPFVIILLLIIFRVVNFAYISVFLLIPMMIMYIKSLFLFYKNDRSIIKRNFWMGSMEDEEEFVESGYGWYRQRWCMARNLFYGFVLILICINCAIKIGRAHV